ncbi:hypothetical protein RF11_14158 [Thelohanellus kitauei]|uniref:Uncharacterized protein n=1 Tax=Thelohanellus kitauei TaxID=669202 RepID=A0A0C2IYG0_THEKT|nr:hypothetical protein RF11_14158 [Thelohanellus kitauei]
MDSSLISHFFERKIIIDKERIHKLNPIEKYFSTFENSIRRNETSTRQQLKDIALEILEMDRECNMRGYFRHENVNGNRISTRTLLKPINNHKNYITHLLDQSSENGTISSTLSDDYSPNTSRDQDVISYLLQNSHLLRPQFIVDYCVSRSDAHRDGDSRPSPRIRGLASLLVTDDCEDLAESIIDCILYDLKQRIPDFIPGVLDVANNKTDKIRILIKF